MLFIGFTRRFDSFRSTRVGRNARVIRPHFRTLTKEECVLPPRPGRDADWTRNERVGTRGIKLISE